MHHNNNCQTQNPSHTLTNPSSSSMATRSSPKLISPITTDATNGAVSPTKKPLPLPWTHQETVNLIRAYQEKWYSLQRGPLRANQWEEVAVVVAARCGYDFNHPSKSAIQCRHKMEKLRQRHRAEKHKGNPAARIWPYSCLMNELEHGPLPISARPLMSMPASNSYDDNEDEDEEVEETENYAKSKSINYILHQRSTTTNNYRGVSGFSKEKWEVEDVDDEEEAMMLNEKGLVSGLGAEIRAFADRFIGMESLKMEIMKETERCRLEMENKRIKMIHESQRRIVDSIGRAFGSSKRTKMSHES